MARLNRIPQVFNKFIYVFVFLCCFTNLASANVELDEDNWRQILDGEWMVEFYAPWCPACTALSRSWKDLSNRARDKNLAMKTAAIDVTESPGLSGRFVVTALPTIFHVKDGEFRQYKGPRDTDSMLDYVERGRWKQTDAVPAWKAPHSFQMGLVAQFFRLSQALRGVHNTLMATYGLSMWSSYFIFAFVTIFVGALLGLILVCVIDLLYPPRKPEKILVSQAEVDRRREQDGKKSDDEELINDDIIDDAEPQESDAEKNSPSDTSEDDDKEKAAGDDAKNSEKPELRKRRTRKAD